MKNSYAMRLPMIVLLLLLFVITHAQRRTPPSMIVKKPLAHAVYDLWKEITWGATLASET